VRKIIATDFDGTLTVGGFAPHIREAIERFRTAGNLFGIVTGRDHSAYAMFQNDRRFAFDFVISCSGALAMNREGQVLFQSEVDGALPLGGSTLGENMVRRILDITGKNCGITFGDRRIDFHADYPQGGDGYAPHSAAASIGTFVMANTHCDTPEETTAAAEVLRKEFGDYLNPQQNGMWMDIPPSGTDKGWGIARYAALMGVPENRIWTAGDNYNDIAMLQRFRGCAMASGMPAVQETADYVCRDIAEVIALAMQA